MTEAIAPSKTTLRCALELSKELAFGHPVPGAATAEHLSDQGLRCRRSDGAASHCARSVFQGDW